MTRRRLAAIAVLPILLGLALIELPALRQSHVLAPARIGAVGAPALTREVGGATAPSSCPSIAEQALARAYAALGAASDGDAQRLSALDPEARARLDEARRLLEDSPSRANASIPHAGATQSAAMPGVAREFGGATPASSAPGASADLAGAIAAPPAAMTLDLKHAVDPSRALRDGADGPELLEPGLWAKVPFRPDQRSRLVVADRCDGGYAVAFYGGDFSTIRLDGGLVVPGRFYHVHGDAVITGAAPCSVDIRPLAAVPAVAEQPARPPRSNG